MRFGIRLLHKWHPSFSLGRGPGKVQRISSFSRRGIILVPLEIIQLFLSGAQLFVLWDSCKQEGYGAESVDDFVGWNEPEAYSSMMTGTE